MDQDEVEVHKHAKKELGQYPAILTSHLVNNPYVQQLYEDFTLHLNAVIVHRRITPTPRITFPSTHLYIEVERDTDNKGSCPCNQLKLEMNENFLIEL